MSALEAGIVKHSLGNVRDRSYGMNMLDNKLVDWFVPRGIRGQTNIEMARIFVFTHLFGPIIAQPMAIYLYIVSPDISFQLQVMVAGIVSFLALPFVLKYTGDINLPSMLSFVGLSAVSLFGTYHYGGFVSPFLPWVIVSLLLGFFYLSKQTKLVLGIFALNLLIFGWFLSTRGFPQIVSVDDLRILSWLSIFAATIYMSWMALYYSRVMALRVDLEHEAERFRATMDELNSARIVSETVNAQRSQFFSKMSHELRTPLNAIIGYSDILLEDATDSKVGNEQTVKDLGRINSAGKHLLSLVSEVLNLDNIVNDVNVLDISEFSAGDILDEALASAQPIISKSGNRLDVICKDRDFKLVTDQTKLRQILINLLSNAGKFTKNGVVTLELAVDGLSVDRRLHIIVADTGIGISETALPKLFKSYMQADETIAKRFGGTGIGLAISRKFAVLLGGEIQVSSKLGAGSSFHVDIPVILEVDRVEKLEVSDVGLVAQAA